MVKKLISGLLGRKESAPAADDIPDELPPLAEDMLVQESQAPAPAKQDTPAPRPEPRAIFSEPAEMPDELPSLDLDEHEEVLSTIKHEDEPKEETPEPAHELPEAIRKAKAAKQESMQEIPPKLTASIEKPIQSSLRPSITEEEAGFFGSVLTHIRSKDGSKEKLLSGDLFARMSSYYEMRKGTIKQGTPLQSEQRLEIEMQKKLEELRIIEQKWHIQKMALQEDLKFLHDREREIQAKVEELKKLNNELGMFKNVSPEHYFHMNNDLILKNIHDLLDALEIIDEDTYKHHVTHDRNDFADWITEAIKNKKLAEKIDKCATREEMIAALESEPILLEQKQHEYKHQVPPKSYFYLANGVVIKSVQQLSDALKTMDEQLYEKHVSTKKNDFSTWIQDVLKHPELAQKMAQARTRKEMADVLDVYL